MGKKLGKNIRNWLIATSALTAGLYFSSPKLGYITHKIQEDITDTLGQKKLLADKETNDIINLIAGKITKEDFITLLAKHGQKIDSNQVDLNDIFQYDPALYNTIIELQTKYGNPKITFGGDHYNLEQGENEPHRANINTFNNTINIHQLDSLMIKFKEHWTDADYASWTWSLWGFDFESRKSHMINNWIAELSHAKQLKERWMVKFSIDWWIDYLKAPGKYEKQYHIPWTIEYQAHKEYEPALIKEFIETYEKYTKNNPQFNFKIAKFYGGFFEKYKDEEKALDYLQKWSDSWDAVSSYIIGKHMFNLYAKHYNYALWLDENAKELIGEKELSMQQLLDTMIHYYKIAYEQWYAEAGPEIINICSNFAYKKKRRIRNSILRRDY